MHHDKCLTEDDDLKITLQKQKQKSCKLYEIKIQPRWDLVIISGKQ